jgi:hypothetical protein
MLKLPQGNIPRVHWIKGKMSPHKCRNENSELGIETRVVQTVASYYAETPASLNTCSPFVSPFV